ncbi:MAG: DUF4468 domain-containing protein [Bacteroidales bacterium]|nr:DUF4468 domain-containing protein [Bacteroidales bacterium]HOI31939.1 DUF4468 domain-containing protein [Bacteroidales bacterium]
MKKRLIKSHFFLFVMLPIMALAQIKTIPFDAEAKKIKFQQVIEEEGEQMELFNRCIFWLNDYYKDPVRVTIVRDAPSGKIMGKHTIRLKYTDEKGLEQTGPTVIYEFTVEVKDNRYRYTITDLLLKTASRFEIERWLDKEDPAYDPRWENYLDQIAEYVDQWSAFLIEKMKPEPVQVEDEW